jgi:hypothetical protein
MPDGDRTTAYLAERVARALGAPGLAEALARLPGSDLQSLLMHVLRTRALQASPAAVLGNAEKPLFAPSAADGRLLHRLDSVALRVAAAFEAVDLSPVEPLGTNAALGGIDPNNLLGALRGAEVLGDPTVALALAAASRRRPQQARAGEPVRLCATHRCVRLQPVDVPGFTQHFRLFVLVTAGRDTGEHRFEAEALSDHLATWLRIARALREDGFCIDGAEVEISDTTAAAAVCEALGASASEIRATARAHREGAARAALEARGIRLPSPAPDPFRDLGDLASAVPSDARLRLDRARAAVAPRIASEFPEVPVRLDLGRLEGLRYYEGLCFRIRLLGPPGALAVIDGGFTGWTQALLADRKERLLTSGMGSELCCKMYGPGTG